VNPGFAVRGLADVQHRAAGRVVDVRKEPVSEADDVPDSGEEAPPDVPRRPDLQSEPGSVTMPPDYSAGRGIAEAADISSRFFASVVSGGLLGWLLDRWLGTWPWLVSVGTIAGFVLGFYWMLRYAREMERRGR
jgi:ATP synthase protein I